MARRPLQRTYKNTETLLAILEEESGYLNERNRDIFQMRLGLNGEPNTLVVIGDKYNVTRECIRQNVARVLQIIERSSGALTQASDILKHMIKNSSDIVWIEDACKTKKFFNGLEDHSFALNIILQEINRGVHVVRADSLDGKPHFFALIDQNAYDALVTKAKQTVRSCAERQLHKKEAAREVAGVVPPEARELVGHLWDIATQNAIFSNDHLVSARPTLPSMVVAILNESDTPMRIADITAAVEARFGRTASDHHVGAAAQASSILLGHGVYGLDKHIPLSEGERASMRDEAYDLMKARDHGRQWHASEIAKLIGCDDEYIVNAILLDDERLSYLGRLMWSVDKNTKGTKDRIQIVEFIKSELIKEGGPLSTQDLKDRILQKRGVKGNVFQIHPKDDVIRISKAMWGLRGRDQVIPEESGTQRT